MSLLKCFCGATALYRDYAYLPNGRRGMVGFCKAHRRNAKAAAVENAAWVDNRRIGTDFQETAGGHITARSSWN